MEDSALAPSSKLSSSSFPRTAAEGCYTPSTWISNAQISQMSLTQSANRGGKVLTGSYFPISGHADVVGTHSMMPGDESGVSLPAPFQQNGAVKPELTSNVMLAYNAYHENVGSTLPASVSLPHQGLLQACGNTTGDAVSLGESLHKIHHLALNTSLSLDACCPPERKLTRGMQLSSHNLPKFPSVGVASDSSFSGINIVQPSFLPRHGAQLQSESSSGSKPDRYRSTSEQNDGSHTQSGITAASFCQCNESVGLNAPGTELSLAIASVVDNGVEQDTEESHSFLSALNGNAHTIADSSIEKSVSRKDEMYLKFVQQVRELEVQLQERKEWAHQKALQAACKFSKDMSELKSLRLEHEEILRLKRDTQALEDSTMKRLTELESALRKAGAQVDRANATVRKLETENAELRAEMEAAKLSAAESNAKCQEVAKREKKSSKKIQAWEKQKAKMLDEMVKQKQQIARVQEQLSEVKVQQHEAEMRWRQEEKSKDDAVLLADAEKWEKEQLEVVAKRREETWCQKADADFQRHKDDIKRLEGELEQLKKTTEACTAEFSSGGLLHSVDTNGLQVLKDTKSRLLRELVELQDSRGDIRRDRECVMCMSEESSVVFLPCAHQIVCVKCNDLHQKRGMRDCPSCRTVIQRRIHVFGARTT